MDGNFSSCKIWIILQILTCLIVQVISAKAKIKGTFKCTPPRHTAILCQDVHLPAVNAGFFNCSGYSVGDKCTLTCDDDYYPSSTKYTVCEEYDEHKANWTVGKFQCSEITCPTTNLPTVTNGSFDCAPNTNISKGEACTVTCKSGFYPAFSRQAVCEEKMTNQGGVWSDGSFVCHEITCSTNNLPIVGEGSFDCAPNTDVSMGEACALICNNGFYPAYSSQAVCEEEMTNQGGVWSDGSFVCHAITCQDVHLPTVNAGFFNCSGYSVGDKCTLTCDDDYFPSSTNFTVCEEYDNHTANWTVGKFECSAITCWTTNLPTVAEGYFECAPNSTVSKGEVCSLKCNDRFYPAYSNQTVCETGTTNQGGMWSNGSFVCRAITCQNVDLPTVNAGFFNCSGYSVGDKCNLTCNHGYYPSSFKETVCEEYVDYTAHWTDWNFQCSEITCLEDLPQPQHGNLEFPSPPIREGDTCTLTCYNDRYPSPSNQAVCRATKSGSGGRWFPESLFCRDIKCNEWNEWNGSEYKFTSTRQTWEESRLLCESDNSHLVTIENKEENEFVRKIVWRCDLIYPRWAWIGLNDRNTEGTWEWRDGTVPAYRNWHEGQPNGGDGQDCVDMFGGNGEWYDYGCHWTDKAVCERNNTLT